MCRMTLDRRDYHQIVEINVELAQKASVAEIVGRAANELKDEAEPYRKMVMETQKGWLRSGHQILTRGWRSGW
jgi:hypothetical protein